MPATQYLQQVYHSESSKMAKMLWTTATVSYLVRLSWLSDATVIQLIYNTHSILSQFGNSLLSDLLLLSVSANPLLLFQIQLIYNIHFFSDLAVVRLLYNIHSI